MDKTVKFHIQFDSNGEKVLHTLELDAGELREAVAGVTSEVKRMQSSADRLGNLAMYVNAANDVLGQLQGVVSGLASEFDSFDKGMRAVNTMAGKDAAGFGELKSQVTELSKVIPLTKDELANGLYQVISNGVPEDNWISFLNQSSRAAVGGIADLGETVTVTSTLIKNYGLDWAAAGEIQDKIQTTAKNGVTSFEQLAAALPRVSGNAATLGVTVDELMASFATLTGVSGNTAEVSTQLAAVFTALMKPSSEASKLAQKMGIEFDAAAIKAAGGFKNFVSQLSASVSEYASKSGMLEQEIYATLFGSAESLRALGPLTGELSEKFVANIDAMSGSVGTIDAAFEDMSGSGDAVTQLLKNQVSALTEWAGKASSAVAPYTGLVSVVAQSAISLGLLGKALRSMMATMAASSVVTNSYVASLFRAKSASELLMTAETLRLGMLRKLNVATAALATTSGMLTAALGVLVVGLGVLAVGYVKLKKELEDTDDKSREYTAQVQREREELSKNNDIIRQYLPIAQDARAKTEDRAKAIEQLKQTFPDYFKNLDTETAKQYNVADAVEASNQKLRDQLRLKAQAAQQEYLSAKENYEMNHPDGQNVTIPGVNNGLAPVMALQEKAEVERKRKLAEAAIAAAQEADQGPSQPMVIYRPVSPAATTPRPVGSGTPAPKKGGKGGQTPPLRLVEGATELKDIENNVAYYQEQLKHATSATAASINQEIAHWQQLGDEIRNAGKATADTGPKLSPSATRLKDIEENVRYWQEQLGTSDKSQAAAINEQIARWQRLADEIRNAGQAVASQPTIRAAASPTTFAAGSSEDKQQSWQNARSLADTIQQRYEMQVIGKEEALRAIGELNKALGDLGLKPIHIGVETEDIDKAKQKFNGAVDSVNAMGQSFSSLGSALEVPEFDVAGTMAQAIATMVAGYATATSQSAALGPWAWIGFAATGLAQLAAMVSSVKSIGKFADGGIAYGPTLGLFGEYAGASSNPEVVAPLDKLRSLIQPQGGGIAEVRVTGRLRGSDIVLSGDNVRRLNRKYHNP